MKASFENKLNSFFARFSQTLALLSRFQEELFVNQEEPKEANAEDDNDKGW